jgi:hypothetical protein
MVFPENNLSNQKSRPLPNGIFWLSHQGSNLDFPESKSGVLPVTPWDNTCKEVNPYKNPCQHHLSRCGIEGVSGKIRLFRPVFGSAKVELFFLNR